MLHIMKTKDIICAKAEQELYERRKFMKRFAMDWLEQWKNKKNRKPLIVEGASGVGKTWLIKEFGEKEYSDTVYVDFKQKDDRIKRLFEGSLDIGFLLSGLEVYSGKQISTSDILIIFDNIQEMPQMVPSLRCFYEDIQDYHVICASSLLNIVSLYDTVFSLTGKVEILQLYPMSFQEFFQEVEPKEHLRNFLSKGNFTMTDIFRKNYVEVLKNYFFVGGMPEAVLQFIKYKDLDRARDVQWHILNAYKQYFTDYAPSAFRSRVCAVWASIPHQLVKENKKFVYDLIQEGGRAKFYEKAIKWLSDCGFVYKVNRVTQPQTLLEEYDITKTFKLFMMDIGLLGCMLGLRQDMISSGNALFDAFNGALTEQYVLQHLVAISGWNVHYYANERSACEISCLIDNGRIVIPVDVVTKINLKAKRLQTYMEKFNPVKAVQISMADYNVNERILHLPIYAVEKIIAELGV